MVPTADYVGKTKGAHALVFISIIYGLCIVQFFEVWALILRTGTLRTFLLPPSILTVAASLLVIEFWWASYESTERIGSKFHNFFISVLETLLFFLVGGILKSVFEKQGMDADQLSAMFIGKRSVLFSLGIVINLLFMLEDWKHRTRVTDVFRTIGVVLCLIALILRRTSVDYVVAYALLVSIVAFTVVKALPSGIQPEAARQP